MNSKNRRRYYGKLQPNRQFAFIYHKRFLFRHLCFKAQHFFCVKYPQNSGRKGFCPCLPLQAGLQHPFYPFGLSRISFLDGIPYDHRCHRVLRSSSFLFFQRLEKITEKLTASQFLHKKSRIFSLPSPIHSRKISVF